jgi:hypothetical protein
VVCVPRLDNDPICKAHGDDDAVRCAFSSIT